MNIFIYLFFTLPGIYFLTREKKCSQCKQRKWGVRGPAPNYVKYCKICGYEEKVEYVEPKTELGKRVTEKVDTLCIKVGNWLEKKGWD